MTSEGSKRRDFLSLVFITKSISKRLPTKFVRDKDGLDACDIGLFQNTAVGSSILPFNAEYTTETSLIILLQAFEMATVGSPHF